MRHFVYSMAGDDDAPAGGGNTSGWFFYYKWGQFNTDDEVFVPFPDGALNDNSPPEKDDVLWFFLDGALLGAARVLRSMSGTSLPGIEVWYHTNSIRRTDVSLMDFVPATGQVTAAHDLDRLHEVGKLIGV